MVKVLFVCLGNICRSPVAEAIFNKRVRDLKLNSQFLADSAGTSAYHLGEKPDYRSVRNALENGIRVDHRARQFTDKDFEKFQYIVAMDKENLDQIQAVANRHNVRHSGIFLMRSFQEGDAQMDVPDPYFGGQDGFQKVFDILHECNEKLIAYLRKVT